MRVIAVGRDAKGHLSDSDFIFRSRQWVSCATPAGAAGRGRAPRRSSVVSHKTSRPSSRAQSATPLTRGLDYTPLQRRTRVRSVRPDSEGRGGKSVRGESKPPHSFHGCERPTSSTGDEARKRVHAALDIAWQKFGEARVFIQHNCFQQALLRLESAKYLIDTTEAVGDCCSVLRRRLAMEQLGKELSAISHSCIIRGYHSRKQDPTVTRPPSSIIDGSFTEGCKDGDRHGSRAADCSDADGGGKPCAHGGGNAGSTGVVGNDFPCMKQKQQLFFTKLNNYMGNSVRDSRDFDSVRRASYGSGIPVAAHAGSGVVHGSCIQSVPCGSRSPNSLSCGSFGVSSHSQPAAQHLFTAAPASPMRVPRSCSDFDGSRCSSCNLSRPGIDHWRPMSGGQSREQEEIEGQRQNGYSFCTPHCSRPGTRVDKLSLNPTGETHMRADNGSSMSPVYGEGHQRTDISGGYLPSSTYWRALSGSQGNSQSRDGMCTPNASTRRSSGMPNSASTTHWSYSQNWPINASPQSPVNGRRMSVSPQRNRRTRVSPGTNVGMPQRMQQDDSIFDLGEPKLVKLYSFERRSPSRRVQTPKRFHRFYASGTGDAPMSAYSSMRFDSSSRSRSGATSCDQSRNKLSPSLQQHVGGLSFNSNRNKFGVTAADSFAAPGVSYPGVSGSTSSRGTGARDITTLRNRRTRGNFSHNRPEIEGRGTRDASLFDGRVPGCPLPDGAQMTESVFHRYFDGIRSYQQARMLHKRVVEQLLLEHEVEEIERENCGEGGEYDVNRKEVLLHHLEDAYNRWLVSHLGAKQKLLNREEMQGGELGVTLTHVTDEGVEERRIVRPSSCDSAKSVQSTKVLGNQKPHMRGGENLRRYQDFRSASQATVRTDGADTASVKHQLSSDSPAGLPQHTTMGMIVQKSSGAPQNELLGTGHKHESAVEGCVTVAPNDKLSRVTDISHGAHLETCREKASTVRDTVLKAKETNGMGAAGLSVDLRSGGGSNEEAHTGGNVSAGEVSNVASLTKIGKGALSNASDEQEPTTKGVVNPVEGTVIEGSARRADEQQRDLLENTTKSLEPKSEAASEVSDGTQSAASVGQGPTPSDATTKSRATKPYTTSDVSDDAKSVTSVEQEPATADTATDIKDTKSDATSDVSDDAKSATSVEQEPATADTATDIKDTKLDATSDVSDDAKSVTSVEQEPATADTATDIKDTKSDATSDVSDDAKSATSVEQEPATADTATDIKDTKSDATSDVSDDAKSATSVEQEPATADTATDIKDTKSDATSDVSDDAKSVTSVEQEPATADTATDIKDTKSDATSDVSDDTRSETSSGRDSHTNDRTAKSHETESCSSSW
ncbi:hypothetical protein, conserved [Trypanosoma brucei gambiense DAL972]|uniref:Uncharacterized protein n=1 Tax=Trypanosoma brucei gambiense (strain MHOM/CI/86/DAL972) TaxID=679716 RepID=C9ZRW2_TRYB9|nr:hypothetical protein, conserved [Trypanosoma brucei gambiense DAL972]CBH12098.1 hypothetical protein, conserved [Trypanosoma brucei gambiense DAL972]|eukprot:XP_011774381.1 hypothetical protein, conserved [Trypanosoma brucei gambiense DAL972]